MAALLVVAGCAGTTTAAAPPGPVPITTTTTAVPASTAPDRTQVAVPVRVRVERVAIDSTVIPLAVLDDGQLETPSDYGQAGWWRDGPEPGEVGPAVIAAHVDSARLGPAAFYRLRDLVEGDVIRVDRADGTFATFRVYRTERFSKSDFPVGLVYGETDDAELRLITCGGQFDRAARSYVDNIVVYADLLV